MVGVMFYMHEICLRSVKALCSALMDSICGMCSGSPVLILVQCDIFKVCFSSSHRDFCYWIIRNLRISYSRNHYTEQITVKPQTHKCCHRLPAWKWRKEIRKPTDTTGSCTLSLLGSLKGKCSQKWEFCLHLFTLTVCCPKPVWLSLFWET